MNFNHILQGLPAPSAGLPLQGVELAGRRYLLF